MLIQRANKYRSEPTPYQAQAMGQWVGTCRHEVNHALERRQYEYRNYGFSLSYGLQAKELTGRRAAIDRIDFVPVHALQYALRALDTAFQRFFAGLGGYPKPRKKFKNDSFTLPAEDVQFKRLNKNHGAINLPKIGWVNRSTPSASSGTSWPSCSATLPARSNIRPTGENSNRR